MNDGVFLESSTNEEQGDSYSLKITEAIHRVPNLGAHQSKSHTQDLWVSDVVTSRFTSILNLDF